MLFQAHASFLKNVGNPNRTADHIYGVLQKTVNYTSLGRQGE